MALNYVQPKAGLRQEFDMDNYEPMTPQELAELESNVNPHGVRPTTVTFHADFTLADAAKTGVTMKFDKHAVRAFAETEHPNLAADLKNMGKRENLTAEVPTRLLVLGAEGTGYSAKSIPFDTEFLINGLKPTHYSNNPSEQYNGSHLLIPGGHIKVCSTGESMEIHKAPENLSLIAAIASHKMTPEALTAPIMASIVHNGETIHALKVEKNSPWAEVFRSEKGQQYLKEKMPLDSPMALIPSDPDSPRITSVPDIVLQKAIRAVERGKVEAKKHMQDLELGSLSASLFPVTSGGTSFEQISAHPCFAGLSPQELAHEMNLPRSISVTVKFTHIPLFGKN